MLRTPVRRSEWLSALSNGNVLLKLEAVQPTSSFKIRGAFNAVLHLKEAGGAHVGLITASAGNHGRGLAYAAREQGLPLTVFIPSTAPRAKIDAIAAAGAHLRRCRDYDEAERDAKREAQAGRGLFVSPYSDADVIAAAGTIALELTEDAPPLDAVIVPVGGGGLVSGIGIVMKALSPATKVIGVEVAASTPFTASLAAGRLVTIDVKPSLADGLTGNLDPDTITLDLVRQFVDEIVVIEEADLRRALAGTISQEHVVIEPAAAAAVAPILSGQIDVRGKTAAAILTGANIDSDTLIAVLSESS